MKASSRGPKVKRFGALGAASTDGASTLHSRDEISPIQTSAAAMCGENSTAPSIHGAWSGQNATRRARTGISTRWENGHEV
jgi:hypothetical protein